MCVCVRVCVCVYVYRCGVTGENLTYERGSCQIFEIRVLTNLIRVPRCDVTGGNLAYEAS